jgi:hypothetical protein
LFVLIDPHEQVTQVISGEFPLEWLRCRVVALLEVGKPLLDLGRRSRLLAHGRG